MDQDGIESEHVLQKKRHVQLLQMHVLGILTVLFSACLHGVCHEDLFVDTDSQDTQAGSLGGSSDLPACQAVHTHAPSWQAACC